MNRTEFDTQNLILWRNDPVLWLFAGKLKFSSLQTCFFLTGLVSVILYGCGWIADKTYTGSGMRFGEAQFLLWVLALVIIFTCFFLLYAWQPAALVTIFQDIERQNIVQGITRERERFVNSYPEFLLQFQKTMNLWIWPALSVFLALGITILELNRIFPFSTENLEARYLLV